MLRPCLLLVLALAIYAYPPQKDLTLPEKQTSTGRILCPECKGAACSFHLSKASKKVRFSGEDGNTVVDADGAHSWNKTGCYWGWWTFDHFVADWSSAGFRFLGEWQFDDWDKVKTDTFLGAEGKNTLVMINQIPKGQPLEGQLQAIGVITDESIVKKGQQYEMMWLDTIKAEEPPAAVWSLPATCDKKKEEGMKKLDEMRKKAQQTKRAAHALSTLTNHHTKTAAQAIGNPIKKKAPNNHHLSAEIDMDLFRTMVTYEPSTWERKEISLPGQKLLGKFMRDVDKKIIGIELSINPKERVPSNEMERQVFLTTETAQYSSRMGYCNVNTSITFKIIQDQIENLSYLGRVTMGGEQCEVWMGELFHRPMLTLYKIDNTEDKWYTASWNYNKKTGTVVREVEEWNFGAQDKAQPATSKLLQVPAYCSAEYKSKCHPADVVDCVENIIKKELFTSNQCQILYKTFQCHKNGICNDSKEKVCTHIKNSGCGECDEEM